MMVCSYGNTRQLQDIARFFPYENVNGIIIHSDASRYTGTTTTAAVDSTYKEKKNGKKKKGSSSTFVTETSEDQYQREGRFYVIKYL